MTKVVSGDDKSKFYFRTKSFAAELEKVPSSASVLVRKDFEIRENLRKAQGGKKLKVLQF